MTKIEFKKLINYLQKDHKVYGPILDKQSKRLLVEKIEEPKDILLNGKVTHYSFKKLFFPACESMFKYKNKELQEPDLKYDKRVAFGMTVFDLKALNLFDQVFSKDPYYQARREKTLVIGYSVVGDKSFEKKLIFQPKYEENILEHVKFDVFLELNDTKKFSAKVFTGSKEGQEVLKEFGLS